jgi:four helix bundle protein
MMEISNDLMERLFYFSVDVIKFLRLLPDSPEARVIKHQLIKAATSGGANYEESQAGVSRREFSMKVAISLKEIREANYWLRIILRTELSKDDKLGCLIKESNELKAILGSIVSKMRTEAP